VVVDVKAGKPVERLPFDYVIIRSRGKTFRQHSLRPVRVLMLWSTSSGKRTNGKRVDRYCGRLDSPYDRSSSYPNVLTLLIEFILSNASFFRHRFPLPGRQRIEAIAKDRAIWPSEDYQHPTLIRKNFDFHASLRPT
jgi:hypothetical protein